MAMRNGLLGGDAAVQHLNAAGDARGGAERLQAGFLDAVLQLEQRQGAIADELVDDAARGLHRLPTVSK